MKAAGVLVMSTRFTPRRPRRVTCWRREIFTRPRLFGLERSTHIFGDGWSYLARLVDQIADAD